MSRVVAKHQHHSILHMKHRCFIQERCAIFKIFYMC